MAVTAKFLSTVSCSDFCLIYSVKEVGSNRELFYSIPVIGWDTYMTDAESVTERRVIRRAVLMHDEVGPIEVRDFQKEYKVEPINYVHQEQVIQTIRELEQEQQQ